MTGLTRAEVEERVERGQTNAVKEVTSRSYWHIIRANVFTRFNAILGTLFVVILLFGQLWDGFFGIVILVNTLIGIIQEVRAKRTLDRLSLISAPRTRVVRDCQVIEIPMDEVVLDDVIELSTGDQVVADGLVLDSQGLEVDESLLTGESEPVDKAPGDEMMSGSFVVAGSGRFRATNVGVDSYARKLASQARRFQVVSSELMDGINRILRVITWIMIPAGTLLFISQLRVFDSFGRAVPGTVAGLVGMVPEGLVLLTSVAFAVSVVRLGRRNVLVQELPAVEGLARVDVVCLDKTGTLTEGNLVFNRLEVLDSEGELPEVLGAFGADSASHSTTLDAIAAAFPSPEGWSITSRVPFSSIRKWSAETFGDKGTWVLGAPEVLLENVSDAESLRPRVGELAGSGMRVLMLASAKEEIDAGTLPGDLKPAALLLFEEQMRSDAGETLQYFTDQGVTIKVISGDNPDTVATVANRAGVLDVGDPVDARSLPGESGELARIMDEQTVFGRVTPDQKEAMVGALQSKGHVVAMTGDGVNDVLALKKADIGIAMGSGSPATRAIAQLVLLDGRFATLPGVVAEGRRVIGNIELVANLFITKTVYATLLSIIIGLAGWAFIFLPRHLTLIGALTIGTPAFFLALAPNKARYRPGFVKRVLRFTLPAGIVAALAAFAAGALSRVYSWVSLSESRTAAVLVIAMIGLWVLGVLARPFTFWKALLVMAMVAGLLLAILLAIFVPYVRDILALDLPSWSVLAQTMGIAAVAIVLIEIAWRFTGWRPRGDQSESAP